MHIALLSGGVGGARLARGLVALPGVDLSVIVNTGDDDTVYGLSVSPDLDTVLYTMAGIEGAQGWGLAGDTWTTMDHLRDLGVDTRFMIGDGDLATNLFRTQELDAGVPLSEITGRLAEILEIDATVLPMSDDPVRTKVLIDDGSWLSFQEYFVVRAHEDEVRDVRFAGAAEAAPAPGVEQAIRTADAVVIGPSNPPLSIWPILAVPGITEAVSSVDRVVAISPLFGGQALKGPAHRVLTSLGFPGGNEGVAAAYGELVHELIIDLGDAHERGRVTAQGMTVHVRDTRFPSAAQAVSFGEWLIEVL